VLFRKGKTSASSEKSQPIWLSDLLSAFTDAAFRATEAIRSQHLSDMEGLYDRSTDPADSTLNPKTVKLGVTPFVLPSDGPAPPLEVPIAALMQSNPLTIDEMTFDFECKAIDLRKESSSASADAPSQAAEIQINFDRPGAEGCPLRVSVRFKAGQPPQVQARICDALIRGVQ
jgi:hypothetical protein